jgi:hypothetical protein
MCWLDGWDRYGVLFIVMVVKEWKSEFPDAP